jgi:hypothetical protein
MEDSTMASFHRILLFWLAVGALTSPPRPLRTPQPGTNLAPAQVASPARFLGKTPEEIGRLFGRPAAIVRLSSKQPLRVDAYTIRDGGRVGFVSAESGRVVAGVYDNLTAQHFFPLTTFFPQNDPRGERQSGILSVWAHNPLPGDDRSGSGCRWTVLAKWSASGGNQIVVRYRLDDHGVIVPDPAGGESQLLPPTTLDEMRVIQWGLLSPECPRATLVSTSYSCGHALKSTSRDGEIEPAIHGSWSTASHSCAAARRLSDGAFRIEFEGRDIGCAKFWPSFPQRARRPDCRRGTE